MAAKLAIAGGVDMWPLLVFMARLGAVIALIAFVVFATKADDKAGFSPRALAFETAAAACIGNATCLRVAFETAFGNECRAQVGKAMETLYRFHDVEPAFEDVDIETGRLAMARGSNLFVQGASGAYARKRWICLARRGDAPDLTIRPEYTVSVWH